MATGRTVTGAISVWLAAALVGILAAALVGSPAFAAVLGDDYPTNLKNAAQDSIVDPWRFYNRECTSFVAWRLNHTNRAKFNNFMAGPNGKKGQFGNAGNWNDNALKIGFRVNNTPAVGAVAQTEGHVAWVAAVGKGTVTIEEYNYSWNGNYHSRVVPTKDFKYIHIKDLPKPATPKPPKPKPEPALPPADLDGDGTPDSADRCPRYIGPTRNRGCALYDHTVTGNFSGNDGLTDVLTFYDYGDDSLGAWVFPGVRTDGVNAVDREKPLWRTPNGTWNWSSSKFVAGNFAGNDAYTDVIGFYDYGSDDMGVWLFRGTADGLSGAEPLWRTGPRKWNMASSTFLVGDFAGHDDHSDVLAMYDYGSDEIGSWVLAGNGNGLAREQAGWRTGKGKWNYRNTQFLAGEFDGKAGTDVQAFYDYGSADLGSWLFPGATVGVAREQFKWRTGPGKWQLRAASYLPGTYNNDALTDVTAFYDYGDAELGAWTFPGSTNGLKRETLRWRSGPGKWNSIDSKWFALGTNPAGNTDAVAFYNYSTDNLGAWNFAGADGGVNRANMLWTTGNGHWHWPSM